MSLRHLCKWGLCLLAISCGLMHPLSYAPAAEEKELDELKSRIDQLEKKQNPAEGEAYQIGTDLNFRASWKDGLLLWTTQNDYRIHIGGRIHQDWGWGDADGKVERDLGTLLDGALFRRLRLRMDGTIYEIMDWVTEIEFAGGTAQPSDVYMDLKRLPFVGGFRAGHFKEPFSLEQLTSDNYVTFLERSLLDDAFVPARNLGFMLHNELWDERLTWAIGCFRPETEAAGFDFGNRDYSITGRITVLPWYEADGRFLFHLGVAGSHRREDNEDGRLLQFRARPELRAVRFRRNGVTNEPLFVDTGEILADSVNLAGAEAAVVLGPFSLQGEFMIAAVSQARTAVDNVLPGTAVLRGFYVMASYFPTGEHRMYSRSRAAFDNVLPHENFFFVRTREESESRKPAFGKGAWEITLRYSVLDLDNTGIEGGTLQDITWGLNWYLNPNARFMWNFILARREGPGSSEAGWAKLFGMRIQWHF